MLHRCPNVSYTESWEDVDEEEDEGSCCSSDDCDSMDGGQCAGNPEAAPAREHEPRCAEDSPCRSLRALIDEEGLERLYPPLDGTAFYRKICHMNVSSDPLLYISSFIYNLF